MSASATPPMPIAVASYKAMDLVQWLHPACDKIEIAGSVRRERPLCNDIDLVCISSTDALDRDLLGAPRREGSRVWRHLSGEVLRPDSPVIWRRRDDVRTEPNPQCSMFYLQYVDCAVDVFLATPETFATRLLCRTGPVAHNIWLVAKAKAMGLKWDPFNGILGHGEWDTGVMNYQGGSIIPTESETQIYNLLGLDFIPPALRDRYTL